jgi:hypothetical protein
VGGPLRTSRGVSHPKFAPSGVFASLAALADAREKSLKERRKKKRGKHEQNIKFKGEKKKK